MSCVFCCIGFVSVVNVTVDIQSDNIVFTCHFISGSFATGCRIRLFQDDSLLHNITVTRQDNNITGSTSLPKDSISSGTYTIEVYNEYNNGLILPNIAYSTTITISVPDDVPTINSTEINLTTNGTTSGPEITLPVSAGVLIIIIVSVISTIIIIIIITSIISVIIIVKRKLLL